MLLSKDLWKTRWEICIYKTSLLRWPHEYIGFTPSCPPHFATKLRPCSQASNLLSFVAMEPNCPQHTVPWSLDTCSTKRSPAHRVVMHRISNRETHLYTTQSNSSLHLTTTIYGRRSGADHRWNRKWLDNLTRLCSFIPDTGTHPT